jgi:hypothetical protein
LDIDQKLLGKAFIKPVKAFQLSNHDWVKFFFIDKRAAWKKLDKPEANENQNE